MDRIPLILACLILSAFFIYFFSPHPAPTPVYNVESHDLIVPITPTPGIVEKINRINAGVNSFTAALDVRFDGKPIRLYGSLAYQKDRHFRMLINSGLGREVDIGSNEKLFWFYSKRMRPSYLYYADYEHIGRSGLRTPFHPIWLMESMGFSKLPQDAGVREKGKYLELVENRVNLQGELIKTITLIDPKKPAVMGHYLFDSADQMIASSEVTAFGKQGTYYYPKQMVMIWYEEKVTLEIDFKDVGLNVATSDDLWVMPKMKRTFNLGSRVAPSS